MKNKNNLFMIHLIVSLLMIFTFVQWFSPNVFADSSIKLIVDGEDITSSTKPVIKNDRTLVPIRMVAEQLGAEVTWNNDDRSVLIIKDDMTVLLRIDSYLIEYDNGEKTYNLSDIAPQIIGDRTFVPLRLVSNALGVGIKWDNDTRSVYVDSTEKSDIAPFFDMKISNVISGQVITGKINLQSILPSELPKGASEIKYLLLNPEDAKGFIISRGKDLYSKYEWLPSIQYNGDKVLVAAIYDNNGIFLAGDSIPVKINVIPEVSLTGIVESQLITENKVPLGANINFSASYVKYEIINPDTGSVYLSTELDPLGTFNMIPVIEDNGNMAVRVIAYDINDNPYSSETINVKVSVERKLSLGGVTSNEKIDKPITLSTSRNFNVVETEYVMIDTITGVETVLEKLSYGNYIWFPGPELSGSKELFVRVKDSAGITYTSDKISVNVIGTPKLLLQGAGPEQVVTGAIDLGVLSNVTLNNVKFILINVSTGKEKVLAEGTNYIEGFTYTPVQGDAGSWKIKAKGVYGGNKTIETEAVLVTIYTNKIYTALPVIDKSKFLGFASKLASDALEETGMSAALQTAQAILETGWGQSVPVDKYDGQFSYNLFGIKGTGTNGSVTSNTWEEYNGVSYRIDANFRAYKSVDESWKDHYELLLTANRYEPFREVMYDSTLGAWALRRCGYATDSKYPMKLMEIIYLYNLQELDKVGI